MNEKITLSGVPETMLQTVYARARESSGRGAVRDRKAEEIIDRLDYDFSLAEKDSAMRSGVIARTIVLDRLTAAWLAKNPGAVDVYKRQLVNEGRFDEITAVAKEYMEALSNC